MQKNLSHRILQRVRDNRSSRNARNLAAFLALREEINSALEHGWTVYQIWDTLHAEQKIAASYNTFCNQVRHLIVKREHHTYESSAAVPAPSPALPRPRTSAARAGRAGPEGFSFSSTPNDEDIL